MMVACQCGCGEPAPIARHTDRRKGAVKGLPSRFIHNHHLRANRNPRWNPDRRAIRYGYPCLIMPGHPLADRSGFVREHQLVVYEAMGQRLLPDRAEIHHFDGDKTNNANTNLVVCPDTRYHKLLHYRQRALKESGNPNWARCRYCFTWDDPQNMYLSPRFMNGRGVAYHRACVQKYQSEHKGKGHSPRQKTGRPRNER